MPLSEEQQHNKYIFNVTQKQIVLDTLKKPRILKKLEELKKKTLLTGREYGFAICSNGKITKMIRGNKDSISVRDVVSDCNGEIDINIHSHPRPDEGYNRNYPSIADWFIDLWIHPRLSSCVYDADYDTIDCYTTSPRLRNKYIPLLKNTETEADSYFTSYGYDIDEIDKKRDLEMYKKKKEEYNKIINEAVKEIVKNIYYEHDFEYLSYPYPQDPKKRNLYLELIDVLPRWGSFDNVWLAKCDFKDLYK